MKSQRGFTIVELLIVIVVIAIIVSISIAVYTGIQARANDARRASDIRQVARLIEAYNAENGSYPSTGSLSTAFTDIDCTNSNPNKRTDWVPGLGADLPQSLEPRQSGYGCYIYASNGREYVVSAWRALQSGPQASLMYRRLGFRESTFSANDGYHCGGPTPPNYWDDRFYQYSYTVSNIVTCNEEW